MSHKSIFKIGVFSNSVLNKVALASLALMLSIMFVPPIATIFGLTQLPTELYLIGLGISLSPILILEITKALNVVE